jgi:beta-phosphoglucomutase
MGSCVVTSGAIFDLDGVLVDTARLHYLAWKKLAEDLGVHFDEQQNEEMKGVDRSTSLELLLRGVPHTFNADAKRALAERKNRYYLSYISTLTPNDVLPGAREAIADCAQHGSKIALASASRNASRLIQLLGLDESFDAIVDPGSVPRSKPDPAIFLLAVQMLRTPNTSSFALEDSIAGVRAIKAAGMWAIGIGERRLLAAAGADAVIESISAFRFEVHAPPQLR